MKRFALASFVLLGVLAFVSPAAVHASTATPATQAQTPPPARAKWVQPVKGIAHIQVIQSPSKKVGNDIITTIKVKNVSDGSIALLRIDELWYNKKLEQVTGDTESIRRPINPGEIVEVTMKSPAKPDLYRSQYAFSHANGKIDVKAVKTFDAKK